MVEAYHTFMPKVAPPKSKYTKIWNFLDTTQEIGTNDKTQQKQRISVVP